MTTPTHPLLPRPTNPVSQPIINSPFHEPDYHWDLDTSAKALNHVLDGRRESQNIPPVAGSRKLRGRIGLPGQFGAVWTPLKLVNDIRKAVLAQIHRRDDYAAAERAIGAREGDGPGTIWGRGGPVSVFSCRGETL